MGERDAIVPVVVRLANREVKLRMVCCSVPGDYDLVCVDSLAGSETVARVGACIINGTWCYTVRPCGNWKGSPRSVGLSLPHVLLAAAEKVKQDAEI